MKYLITLWTAIKNGIIRIFPLPLKVSVIVIVIVSALLISCGSTKMVTQTVRDIHRDTLYVSNYQFDSVYVFKDKITDRSRDTLYIREVQTEYKYRILRDTILKVQHDSIPYEVTKIVTKEIQRPLTWFDHLTRLTFWFFIGFLLCAIAFKLRKVFKR